MVKLRTPDGVIDLDPHDAALDLEGAGMVRDLGADGFYPSLHRDGFLEPGLESGVPRANLREDILDGIEAHRVRPEYMISLRPAIRTALFSLSALVLGAVSGCGYALENSRNNSLKEVGVERVYVAPVKNLTYKPGVENLVYNELVQALLAGRRVKLVDSIDVADAVLESSVERATYTPSATTSASSIYPDTIAAIEITVATEYQADFMCSFRLRRQKKGVASEDVWGSSFTRTRRFAGNNQKIEYGTTSGLINESEFDRTLKEVAHGMMADVHQAMVARF